MNNTKSTKRALLLSIMAMLLCVVLLVGTTFAWFTDSASTGVNKIQAGNLDVTLEYLKDGTWKDVKESTDLFQTDLWEPGTTDVVYLKVTNAGTLALKYKFAVSKFTETVGVNVVNGSSIKLSEILKFGIIGSETQQSYTRDTARAAVAGNALTLNTYTNDIRLGVGETKYYTVVVYMPEETGNEANYVTGTTPPQIELGINLVATQDTFESDSFGYDYDQNAGNAEGYTVTAVIPVETVAKALQTSIVTEDDGSGILTTHEKVSSEQTVNAGGIAVTYPANTVLDTTPAAGTVAGTVASTQDAKQGFTYSGTSSAHSITIGEGENASVYELTLPVSQNNTTLVKVVEKIAADQTMTAVYHNGVAMTKATSADETPTGESYYYNSATGELVLWVYHASEIATVTENKAPVESMFPDVNVTILSSIVASEDTVMTDAASGTSAKIPAAAVEKGIVNAGQKVYLVIETTVSEENSKTYDISIRDANGAPFNWTIDCMPEVKFYLGTAEELFGFNLNAFEKGWAKIYDRKGAERYPEAEYGNQYYDGTGDEYGAFKYGDQYTPGMTYDPETGFVTLRSLTFE